MAAVIVRPVKITGRRLKYYLYIGLLMGWTSVSSFEAFDLPDQKNLFQYFLLNAETNKV